jgi:hypothetical protein
MVYELSVYLLKCFAVMSHWLALFRLLLVGGCIPFTTNNAFFHFWSELGCLSGLDLIRWLITFSQDIIVLSGLHSLVTLREG